MPTERAQSFNRKPISLSSNGSGAAILRHDFTSSQRLIATKCLLTGAGVIAAGMTLTFTHIQRFGLDGADVPSSASSSDASFVRPALPAPVPTPHIASTEHLAGSSLSIAKVEKLSNAASPLSRDPKDSERPIHTTVLQPSVHLARARAPQPDPISTGQHEPALPPPPAALVVAPIAHLLTIPKANQWVAPQTSRVDGDDGSWGVPATRDHAVSSDLIAVVRDSSAEQAPLDDEQPASDDVLLTQGRPFDEASATSVAMNRRLDLAPESLLATTAAAPAQPLEKITDRPSSLNTGQLSQEPTLISEAPRLKKQDRRHSRGSRQHSNVQTSAQTTYADGRDDKRRYSDDNSTRYAGNSHPISRAMQLNSGVVVEVSTVINGVRAGRLPLLIADARLTRPDLIASDISVTLDDLINLFADRLSAAEVSRFRTSQASHRLVTFNDLRAYGISVGFNSHDELTFKAES